MSKAAQGVRYAEIERESAKACVRVVLDLDGGSRRDLGTGIGFLDHMLDVMAVQAHIDLGIKAEGDLHIDDHHLVKEIGTLFGHAISDALGDEPLVRYADNRTVMEDALVSVAVDLRGTGQCFFDVHFDRDTIGGLSTESIPELFRCIATAASLTLHVRLEAGTNTHHICEALFKGFGRALYASSRISERRYGVTRSFFDQ